MATEGIERCGQLSQKPHINDLLKYHIAANFNIVIGTQQALWLDHRTKAFAFPPSTAVHKRGRKVFGYKR